VINFSRRQLATYAVEELLANRPPADIAQLLVAALIAANKYKEAELLIDDINQELESRGLLASAKIITARGLSAELQAELISQLKQAASVKEVVLNQKVEKSVIGGIRLETAKHSWDKTVARQLADIKGGVTK